MTISQHDEETLPKPCESLNDGTTGFRHYTGIICTLITSLAVSIAILLVKILEDYGFDAYSISFWKFLGVTIAIFPVTIFLNWTPCSSKSEEGLKKSVYYSIWPLSSQDNRKTCMFLVINGILVCTAWILRSYSVQFITIGDTLVIGQASPVLVTVLGHFLLRETCGIVPLIIAFSTVGGLVVVSRPPLLTGTKSFDSNALVGTSLALGSLLTYAFHLILTRKFREIHWAMSTFVFGLVGVIETNILCLTFGHFAIPNGLQESLVLSAFILVSFVGVLFDILSLRFETAGTVTLIRCCDVIFGFVLQFIFLGVVPDVYSSIGAAVVLGGILTVAYRKFLSSLPQENPTRQRLSCLLK